MNQLIWILGANISAFLVSYLFTRAWLRRERKRWEKEAANRTATDVETARVEERLVILRYIKVFLETPGDPDNGYITAAKTCMQSLWKGLVDRWEIQDTTDLFEKWGVKP